uniref:Uncharacterized protein n=1 Tax=Rousettus aegyptiacus TaxID=9407 RepID=A0A7J8KAZ3_ROUAE|nr:hypothetical protein HJG63_007897 [Rousettus aegyptiacus]
MDSTALSYFWFNNSGRTGDRRLKISETGAAFIDTFPFFGRKEGWRKAQSVLKFYDYEAKHIHIHIQFFFLSRNLAATCRKLSAYNSRGYSIIFSFLWLTLSHPHPTYFREKPLYIKYELYGAYYTTTSL